MWSIRILKYLISVIKFIVVFLNCLLIDSPWTLYKSTKLGHLYKLNYTTLFPSWEMDYWLISNLCILFNSHYCNIESYNIILWSIAILPILYLNEKKIKEVSLPILMTIKSLILFKYPILSTIQYLNLELVSKKKHTHKLWVITYYIFKNF